MQTLANFVLLFERSNGAKRTFYASCSLPVVRPTYQFSMRTCLPGQATCILCREITCAYRESVRIPSFAECPLPGTENKSNSSSMIEHMWHRIFRSHRIHAAVNHVHHDGRIIIFQKQTHPRLRSSRTLKHLFGYQSRCAPFELNWISQLSNVWTMASCSILSATWLISYCPHTVVPPN